MSVASVAALRTTCGRRCGVGSRQIGGLNGGKLVMTQRRDTVTRGICCSLLSSSNGSAQGLERLPFKPDGYSFWTWRGRRIHYVEQGAGQPIVLIHGFGASAFHWRYNIPELSKKYKVYAIDLLGFGWSEKALVEYEATIWMEQVSDFLREVVKEPAILVGNSLGGFTTLFTATEMPGLVRGVVLLNSAGQFGDPSRPPKAEDEEEESAVTRLVVRPLKEAFQRVVFGFLFWQAKQPSRVEKVLKSVYIDPRNVDDYLIDSITAPAADTNAGEVYYRLMSRFMSNQSRYTLDKLLSKLSCPLLLLWGDLDPWVGPAKAARIKEFYPNTTVVNLQAGHCPHDEAPEQVNKALLEWLASPEASAKPAESSLQARFIPAEFGVDPTKVQICDMDHGFYDKKAEIRRLIESEGIPHIYICCNFFMRYLLPSLVQPGLDAPPRDEVKIFGEGNTKGVFVKETDVAKFTICAIEDPRTLNKTLYLRPPGNVYSMNELVGLWETKINKCLKRIYITEEQLLKNIDDAPFPLKMDLVFIYSTFVKGDHTYFEIDSRIEGTQLYPHVNYTTVNEYLDTLI